MCACVRACVCACVCVREGGGERMKGKGEFDTLINETPDTAMLIGPYNHTNWP